MQRAGPEQIENQLRSFIEEAGYDPSAISNVREDLRSALQKAKDDGVQDPKAFIESALRDSLEANGINAEQLRNDLQSQVQRGSRDQIQSQILHKIESALSGRVESNTGGSTTGSVGGPGAESDLFNQLFGDEKDAEAREGSRLTELADLLQSRLPAGTLFDRRA